MIGGSERARARALFLSCCWALSSYASVFAEDSSEVGDPASARVHVLWHDAYRLFPDAGLDALSEEVETLFMAEPLSVVLHVMVSGSTASEISTPRVGVVLHPIEPTTWSLDKDVMAAAVGARDQGYTIFVFYPAVLRALGSMATPSSPAGVARLARAMGRVVSHELVHVLAPGRGHATHGLMAPSLSRRMLVGQDVWLDATSTRALARSLSPAAPTRGLRVRGSNVSMLPASPSFVWTLR